MQTITPSFVDELIDFAPKGKSNVSESVGKLQRDGTVAAFNMLVTNRCAYLADEVGMGKTYVALAVMSLLRYFDPSARVVVIAPRQNIQQKWRKELINFVRNNWRITGNRVKSLDGTPVWDPVLCNNLFEFTTESMRNQDRDFFLRLPSFSIASNSIENRVAYLDRLNTAIGRERAFDIDTSDRVSFLNGFGAAINEVIPTTELIIVDEAHNLKAGIEGNVSVRNRLVATTFGRSFKDLDKIPSYQSRVTRVLLLSATPFEDDYAAIYRQLSIFGLENIELEEMGSQGTLSMKKVNDPKVDPESKRQVIERLLVRRAASISIGGKRFTKNMYRREWRGGGVANYDQSIEITEPLTKLVVGLMQKKVTELLSTDKFQNSFQIGMLSSFESFSESVRTAQKSKDGIQQAEDEDSEAKTFDDSDQQKSLSPEQKEGIDSSAISTIARSFLKNFDKPLPHPKIDQVAEKLADTFQYGEKYLVFVRRIATVSEIARKVNLDFDQWIQERMERELPDLRSEIKNLFERYRSENKEAKLQGRVLEYVAENGSQSSTEEQNFETRNDLAEEPDEGGVSSFFHWFYRGNGPAGYLSGAAFHKNRILNASSNNSTLFEDNHVANLLECEPNEVFSKLCGTLDLSDRDCNARLRSLAYEFFFNRTKTRDKYPRFYVFESYQFAALTELEKAGVSCSDHAKVILQERFGNFSRELSAEVPGNFPQPKTLLQTKTVFTELRGYPELLDDLWPSEGLDQGFRQVFRRREQRRELFSSLSRLGASFIDLYLVAMKTIGSFSLGQRGQDEFESEKIASNFVLQLNQQRKTDGFHAYYELSQAAKNFDTLISVNFPDLDQQSLSQLPTYFSRRLGSQSPVGEVSGGVTPRLVQQFRMPGFPLVLISTDVLQEGEDLHTFCKQILHYGIAWTPSAIEQRTGRVDRIGGLVQRNLDRLVEEPSADDFIQVYYPHLRDTVEVLQVRRVYRRLNTFYELMHKGLLHQEVDESSIDTVRAVLEDDRDIPQIKEPLVSAFDVKEQWLNGEANKSHVEPSNTELNISRFKELTQRLASEYPIELDQTGSEHKYQGVFHVNGDEPDEWTKDSSQEVATQNFNIRLKSHVAGPETLLQIESDLFNEDLANDAQLRQLRSRLRGYCSTTKVCIEPRVQTRLDRVYVKDEILFDPEITQFSDLTHLFDNTVPIAHAIRSNDKVQQEPKADFQDLGALEEAISNLLHLGKISGTLNGDQVVLKLPISEREQRINMAVQGGSYVLSTEIAAVKQLLRPRKTAKDRLELQYRVWHRNGLKSMVNLYLSPDDLIIGAVHLDAATMHADEVEIYLNTLARDCDRFEFVLTGRDEN